MFSKSRRKAAPDKKRFMALMLACSLGAAQANALTISRAEQLALAADPGAQALQAQASAFAEQAVAANTWADPKLSFGAMDLPGDELDPLNQGMLELKLEQMLPRGDSAGIQSHKTQLQSDSSRMGAANRQLTVLREVRLAWLDTWYWQQAQAQLEQDRYLFESLIAVTESMYSQGRASQRDLLQAEVELSKLDDKIVSFNSGLQQSKARLQRWTGISDIDQVSVRLPEGSFLPSSGKEDLLSHPVVKVADLTVSQFEQDIALAQESYKPQWGVELKYGREQGDMGSMGATSSRNKFSAMVMMDIPLFTDNRQDRQLSASRYQREASVARRLDILQQLQEQLAMEQARYEGLNQRQALYKNQLLPTVSNQSEVTLNAYQSDVGDFSGLIQAYKTHLNLRLEYTRLQADILKSKVRLQYLLPAENDLQPSVRESK